MQVIWYHRLKKVGILQLQITEKFGDENYDSLHNFFLTLKASKMNFVEYAHNASSGSTLFAF